MSVTGLFHEPKEEGVSYVLLRIAFALTALVWFLSLHPFLDLFYGPDALCPSETWTWAASKALISGLWWAAAVASVLMAAGRFTRPASVLVFLSAAFFFRTPCRPDNYGDQIFVSLAFLMMFAPLTRWLPLRAVARAVPRESAWLHKTLRLVAGTLYLVPILHRLGGTQWWDGTAAWTALADPSTSRVWQLLSRNPWIAPGWVFAGLTYLSLAYEGLFPFLIWVRKLRLPMVAAGILFHAVMGALLDLGLFPIQMMVILIGCLDDESISWLVRRVSPERRGGRATLEPHRRA